jgi:hypothetical protein
LAYVCIRTKSGQRHDFTFRTKEEKLDLIKLFRKTNFL